MSTQPSTPRWTVKWTSTFGSSNNNKWRWWADRIASHCQIHSHVTGGKPDSPIGATLPSLHLPFPFSPPVFPPPLYPLPPLRSSPLKYSLEAWGALSAPPAGSEILVNFGLKIWHLVAPVLLIFLRINCYASVLFSAKTKTPDRRPNLSRPYIKLEVYGQTVWLDGGHGQIGEGYGRIAPLDPPLHDVGSVWRVFLAKILEMRPMPARK